MALKIILTEVLMVNSGANQVDRLLWTGVHLTRLTSMQKMIFVMITVKIYVD